MKRLLAIVAIMSAAIFGGISTASGWDGMCGTHEQPVPCEDTTPTPAPAPVPTPTEQTPVVAPQPSPAPVVAPTPAPTPVVPGPHPGSGQSRTQVRREITCSFLRRHYHRTYATKLARKLRLGVCYSQASSLLVIPVTG